MIILTVCNIDWDGKGMRQWVTHTLLFSKPGNILLKQLILHHFIGLLETSHRQVQLKRDLENLVLLAPISKAFNIEYVYSLK